MCRRSPGIRKSGLKIRVRIAVLFWVKSRADEQVADCMRRDGGA